MAIWQELYAAIHYNRASEQENACTIRWGQRVAAINNCACHEIMRSPGDYIASLCTRSFAPYCGHVMQLNTRLWPAATTPLRRVRVRALELQA